MRLWRFDMGIQLEIGSHLYEGFKSFELVKNIDVIASYFVIEYQYGHDQLEISLNQKCRLLYDGLILFTGYVEYIENKVDSSSYLTKISGRSITSDLIDSFPNIAPCEFKNLTCIELISELIKEFDIGIINEIMGTKRIEKWAIDPFMSIAENIHEICSYFDAYACCNEYGQLVLSNRALGQIGILQQGKNILLMELKQRSDVLRSKYKVFSGDMYTKTVEILGRDQSRHRQVNLFGNPDGKILENKAKVSMSRQENDSFSGSIVVSDWFNSDGLLWQENKVIKIEYPIFNIDIEAKIVGLSFRYSDLDGMKTVLLVRGYRNE